MTLSQAQSLKVGQTIYHNYHTNANGTPQRWKVTSVKVWKTRPQDVAIGLRHGLRNYDRMEATINNTQELEFLSATLEEAIAHRVATKLNPTPTTAIYFG